MFFLFVHLYTQVKKNNCSKSPKRILVLGFLAPWAEAHYLSSVGLWGTHQVVMVPLVGSWWTALCMSRPARECRLLWGWRGWGWGMGSVGYRELVVVTAGMPQALAPAGKEGKQVAWPGLIHTSSPFLLPCSAFCLSHPVVCSCSFPIGNKTTTTQFTKSAWHLLEISATLSNKH